MNEPLLSVPKLPLLLGSVSSPHNPDGFPDVYPFDLYLCPSTGALRQEVSPKLRRLLERAYQEGSLMGVAMDDTDFGRKYAEDFLAFISDGMSENLRDCRALEIGAGRGYLSLLLDNIGVNITALEPGREHRSAWERHGVSVVNDFFPTPDAPGPYEMICAFGVLEHVFAPEEFLGAVRKHLEDDGDLLLAVPDCESFIEAGDVSMLVHEHILYLDRRTLESLLRQCGFDVVRIERSGWGGSLYAHARKRAPSQTPVPQDSILAARAFAERATAAHRKLGAGLQDARESGRSIGIYVPCRIINSLCILEASLPPLRFFDDDPELHGKYYPHFPYPIENFDDLCREPVDEVWVMSRTFATVLAERVAGLPGARHPKVVGWSHFFS